MNRHIAFCLCPGAPLFCIAAALEVLRHANRFNRSDFYQWSLVSDDDAPVSDSNGLAWPIDRPLAEAGNPDFCFVVAGLDSARLEQPGLDAWLLKQARAGRGLGGISNGAFVLAANGLLDGYLATTHWEDFESFCLLYPQVRARYQRFVIDRRRLTCAGGSATLDLFIEIVRQDLGHEVAQKIARQMLIQEESLAAPASLPGRQTAGQYSAPVQRALGLIEAGVGQSITVAELADRVGVGRRELLRLFRRELNSTPSRVLALRRLDRARSLILNTRLSMARIADAVGFSSQSHLTSSYRAAFGTTPAQQRRDFENARSRTPLASRELRDW
jgi:AraC family carnitine catabolism transcriptional activator